ncbi:MAG: C40 family peptidase [Campylobacterales bacterium]|nr:C40 family peptidase [Campylobacterales bacterium]
MNNRLKAFSLLIALALGVSSLTAEEIEHRVKSGDTLSEIAKQYSVDIDALRITNGIEKKSHAIKIGQALIIPTQDIKPVAKISPIKGHSSGTVNLASALSVPKKVAKTNKKSKLKSILISHASTFEDSKDIEIVHGGTQDVFVSNTKLASIPLAAKQKLGKRYVWGAVGPNTFDCSGFTMYTCKQEGISIPRTSIEQSKAGVPIPKYALKPGDLVFFDTSKTKRGYVNHVGIYIGDNKFIHASSAKKKVTITSLEAPFYKSRYRGARRYL